MTNVKKQIYIWVTFQKEGIHCYPAAGTDPKLKTGDEYDVSFLAHPHRHVFHFTVRVTVNHTNRDIEFIQFKRWLENLYDTGVLQMGSQSCEMMAENLYAEIINKYPGSKEVSITVSEDGENGATINWEQVDG